LITGCFGQYLVMTVQGLDSLNGWHATGYTDLVRIETTPEMRRFNRAVERADRLLHYRADRLPVPQLVLVLRCAGWIWASEEVEASHQSIEKGEIQK
jgi:hypothetical protein